jgi:hypothetical protein
LKQTKELQQLQEKEDYNKGEKKAEILPETKEGLTEDERIESTSNVKALS